MAVQDLLTAGTEGPVHPDPERNLMRENWPIESGVKTADGNYSTLLFNQKSAGDETVVESGPL